MDEIVNLRRMKKAGVRAAGALFLVLAGAPFASALGKTVLLSCPDQIAGHGMSEIDMFSGPPSEMASLIPVHGRWDTVIGEAGGEPFYIQCEYRDTKQVFIIKVPAAMKSCAYGDKDGQFVCR